ncbi:hypothetical protein NBRC116494_12750 [Aurantivibrio plasticivorans]
MSDDKKKAKDAILGELESIKHLLEANKEGELADPPILTDHFDAVAEDDVPMLTEALSEVLDDIRGGDGLGQDNSEQGTTGGHSSDFDSLDIPVLSPLESEDHAEDDATDIPVLEPLTDESLIDDNSQFQDLDLDDLSEDIPTLGQAAAEQTVEDNDDLVARALKNRTQNASTPAPTPTPTPTPTPASTSSNSSSNTETAEIASNEESETVSDVDIILEADDMDQPLAKNDGDQIAESAIEEEVFDLEALGSDEINDLLPQFDELTPDPPPQETTPSQDSAKPAEHQPSLFDAPKPGADKAKPDENKASATTKAHAPLSARPVKTDNPFLPKHIRDRLHTNRTLQQEIESTHSTAANAPSSSHSSANPSATAAPAASTGMSAADDKLVDEVMKSLMPKFEQTLRAKVRELIAAERNKTDDQ